MQLADVEPVPGAESRYDEKVQVVETFVRVFDHGTQVLAELRLQPSQSLSHPQRVDVLIEWVFIDGLPRDRIRNDPGQQRGAVAAQLPSGRVARLAGAL